MDIFCTRMNKVDFRGSDSWVSLECLCFLRWEKKINKCSTLMKIIPPFRKQKVNLAGLFSVNSVL